MRFGVYWTFLKWDSTAVPLWLEEGAVSQAEFTSTALEIFDK